MTDVNQWDSEIIGMVDKSYVRETAQGVNDQNLNIEFALTQEQQDKRDKEAAQYEKEKAAKKK